MPWMPAFDGRVVRVLRPADEGARDRARREQAAAATRAQMRDGLAEAAEHAREVDVEQLVPARVVELLARHEARDRGIREHDVDAAEPLGGGLEQLAHLVGRAHVDGAPPARCRRRR